jgi:hypothetical protein
MLDSHPEVAVPPESHFLVPLSKRSRHYEGSTGLNVEVLVDDLSRTQFRRWGVSERQARAALSRPGLTSYADAVRALFACYAMLHGKTRYGEKTPINVRSIPLLARLFPEAVFAHLVRDGRDVTLSYLSVPFGPDSVSKSAVYWRLALEQGRKAGLRLAPGRYREFHYEELVEEPESTLQEICKFCHLAYDPAMLRYHERAEDVQKGTNRAAHSHLTLPPTRGLRDWHQDMAAGDVAVFEAISGRTLERFGYERAFRSTPLTLRLRTVGARIHVQAQRALGRAAKITKTPVRSPQSDIR